MQDARGQPEQPRRGWARAEPTGVCEGRRNPNPHSEGAGGWTPGKRGAAATARSVSETSASEAPAPGLQSPAEAAAEDRPPDVKLPAVRLAHGSCVAGSTTVTGHRSEARWPGARTQCRSLSVAPKDGPRTSPMQSVSDGRRFDRTSDESGLQPGLAGAKPQGCVRGRCVRRAPRGLCPGRDPVLQPDKPSAQAAACALTHTHKCTRTQMHTNAHASSVVCERAHTCTHLSSRYMHISMYTHTRGMHAHKHTHLCTRFYMERRGHTHIRTHTQVQTQK